MSKDEAILLCVNKQVVWASQHIHVGIHSYMANMVRKKLNDLSYSYLLLTMIRQTTREVIGGGGRETYCNIFNEQKKSKQTDLLRYSLTKDIVNQTSYMYLFIFIPFLRILWYNNCTIHMNA